MVKVRVEGERLHTYELKGGAYDGAQFICGPGIPFFPPESITLQDPLRTGGTVEVRYEFDTGNADAYRHVIIQRK